MSKYPRWIEPNPGHKLVKNSSGALEHSSGLQFHRDRAQRITVLVTDEREEQAALAPPEGQALPEVIGDGSGTVPVSFDDLVAGLTQISAQCPGLFGPEIAGLLAKLREIGDLQAYQVSLVREIRNLEAMAAKLRHVGPEWDKLRKVLAA